MQLKCTLEDSRKKGGKNDNVRKCDQMFQIKAEQIQGGVKVGNIYYVK